LAHPSGCVAAWHFGFRALCALCKGCDGFRFQLLTVDLQL
jgi:hypothetical protein